MPVNIIIKLLSGCYSLDVIYKCFGNTIMCVKLIKASWIEVTWTEISYTDHNWKGEGDIFFFHSLICKTNAALLVVHLIKLFPNSNHQHVYVLH